MRRTLCSKIARGTILAAVAAALCLAITHDAEAHARRVRRVGCRPARRVVVVRPAPVVVRPVPVVILRPAPVVVRSIPARPAHCVWRSRTDYAPGFGHYRYGPAPRGIGFGVHVRF